MTAVALIPMHHASTTSSSQLQQLVTGQSLVAHAVSAARAMPGIEQVYVSTADTSVAMEASRLDAIIVGLPGHLAEEGICQEVAVTHALHVMNFDAGEVTVLGLALPSSDSARPTLVAL